MAENRARPKPETRNWLLAALLLAAVFLIANSPIVNGSAAPIWDAQTFFSPAFTLVADHARAARIVLWNPWASGGSPDYAEPEYGATSPIAISVGAIFGGTALGFRVYWLLIWFLGPLGLLLLARQWRVPPWAAFVVALGFAFCGFYTGQAEHTSWLYSLSFLPWILWRFDAALEGRALLPALESGGLWGLSALGGYPALTILSGGFLFLWMLGRCLCPAEAEPAPLAVSPAGNSRPPPSFGLVAVALVLVAGLPILAPAYVAFFGEAGSGYSDRGSPTAAAWRLGIRPRDQAIGEGAIQPGALSTFASPYLTTLKFGGRNSNLWPRTDISLTNVYLGASISILALLAIVNRLRSPWRWWLLAVGALFLACALGSRLPVRGWLYDYFPPSRYFRNAAMFRSYAMLSAALLALLAGKDLDAAIRDPAARIWKRFPAAAVLVAAAAAASYFLVIHKVQTANIENRLAIANLGLACVWLGSLAIALWSFLRPHLRRRLPLLLGILAIVDARLTIYLAAPTVYSTREERQVLSRIDAGHRSSLDLTPNGFQREARVPAWIAHGLSTDNENVPLKVATFFNYAVLSNRFHVDFERHPVLVDMSTGSDRIWFSTAAPLIAPTDASYDAFVRRSEALGAPVLVAHPRSEMGALNRREIDAISQLPAARRVPARVISYTPDRLDLEADCPQPGWLLVTDRWSPGWRAKVNGQPTEIFGGDFIFRALQVPAGKNRIQFAYRPAGWPVLPIVSWAMLALIFVAPRVAPAAQRPRSCSL